MVIAWLLAACQRTDGEIVVFQPSPLAPLSRSAIVTFRSPRALVGTLTDGTHERRFDRPALAEHTLELPALYADHTWTLALTSIDEKGRETQLEPVTVTTAPFEGPLPQVDLRAHQPDRMAPGLTLLPLTSVGGPAYLAAFDDAGELAWVYLSPEGRFLEVRVEGDLLLAHNDNAIVLLDWMGRTRSRWWSGLARPGGVAIDAIGLNHELRRTASGTLLTMTEQRSELPSLPDRESLPYTLVPTTVAADVLIEVDPADGAILEQWPLVDVLDPERIGFDSLNLIAPGVVDWTHANAVEDDAMNNAWVVSVRHQDAVVSFDKTTREVNWIAGNPANWHEPWASRLLEPIGDDFAWFWHQHAVKWRPEDGNFLVFDNGNYRAAPFTILPPLTSSETWSRVAEYRVDPEALTIERLWYFDLDPPVFSGAMGDVDHLPNGNVLATYAFVHFEDHVPNRDLGRSSPGIRVVEIDPVTNEVVWDLDLWAPDSPEVPWQSYRASRIASFDVTE